jgi:peptidylprolyl isomerase
MKQAVLIFVMAASAAVINAQTPAKPTAPSGGAAKPAVRSTTTGVKLPPGVPPARGIVKTEFAERYQDIKIGTGADAEPNKMYKVHYTGWLAADGRKFDSSYERRTPVLDKDGKPELDADGKAKMGDPHPDELSTGFWAAHSWV